MVELDSFVIIFFHREGVLPLRSLFRATTSDRGPALAACPFSAWPPQPLSRDLCSLLKDAWDQGVGFCYSLGVCVLNPCTTLKTNWIRQDGTGVRRVLSLAL